MDVNEATRRYRALRGRHRIVAVSGSVTGVRLCEVDGVRVFPVKGGRLRHDRGDIGALFTRSQLTVEDIPMGRRA